jgi:hypothetical protein
MLPLLIPCVSLADLTDADLSRGPLNPSLFPGVPSTVEVHNGFSSEQARYVTRPSCSTFRQNMCSTAPTILSAVQQTLSAHGASSVTVIGHSLGAALALLDSVYLRVLLNASVNVRMVGYGLPRVGNQDFANWVDSNLSGLVTHVNNEEDPIPIVPGISLGFHHPSGEVHITDSGTWENCPGQLFSPARSLCGLVLFRVLTRAGVTSHCRPRQSFHSVHRRR